MKNWIKYWTVVMCGLAASSLWAHSTGKGAERPWGKSEPLSVERGDWRVCWTQTKAKNPIDYAAEVIANAAGNTRFGVEYRGAGYSGECTDQPSDAGPSRLASDGTHFVSLQQQNAAATASPRGTLFRWRAGAGNTGGPNLNEPLVTDRPDFTESGTTVGKGVAQLEFGYTFTDTSAGPAHSLGEPLVRYGVFAEWLEFRVGLAPANQRASAGEDRHTGTEDLYLGFKAGLTPQDGLLPETALIPQINAPTGSNAFTSDHFEPGVNLIYSWEINDSLATAGSTQWNRRIDSGKDYLEMAQSWTLAYSLTDKLGAYTEWYGMFPSGATTERPQHYLNGGFTYLISNDVQLDIRAGVGLNSQSDDFFFGTGMSIRLP